MLEQRWPGRHPGPTGANSASFEQPNHRVSHQLSFSSLTAAAAHWGVGTVSHPQWARCLWSLCPVAADLDLLPSIEPAVRERLGRSPALEML